MTKNAIELEHLSKCYPLVRYGRRKPASDTPHWALKDICFSVEQGDIIGIIGKNGAGKSTLLKILSRITAPTTGRAVLRGKVSSLLEVGTGFHPELSGKENIFLNGAILGMRRREIHFKLDAIINFAEIEKFIDTPVKHYSSGMYVRLAFAVGAHLESEILLVDEVLAVGDFAFQQKCLEKTRDIADNGRTVLFVSHNMGAISRLCKKCIVLEEGRLLSLEDTSNAIKRYVSRSMQLRCEYIQPPDPDKPFHARRISLFGSDGKCKGEIGYGESLHFSIEYEINQPLRGVSVGIGIGTSDHIPVFASADYDAHPERLDTRQPGIYRTRVEIPKQWLNTGKYIVQVYLANGSEGTVYEKIDALQFQVMDTGTPGSFHGMNYRRGVLQPMLDWVTERLQ